MESSKIRKANHAGSWYTSDPAALEKQLTEFLASAEVNPKAGNLKALIGPHAGYRFSGATAAWGYKNIN